MGSLGLDISTSCTGWCLLDDSGNIENIGYIDISKKSTLYEKAKVIKSEISKLNIFNDITEIFIEENLQSFRSGFSSAKTISTLAKFNGIVSYICFQEFSKEPVFFNVNSARKILGISLKRKKDGGKPTKDQLFEWAIENIDYRFPKKILKSGPRKGQEVIDPRSSDMIDAYIVAKAGIESCKKIP
jgi:Holliday junction resolvasome RuvABC endonuclease subunit